MKDLWLLAGVAVVAYVVYQNYKSEIRENPYADTADPLLFRQDASMNYDI